MEILAWHFCDTSRKTRWNNLPIVVGETLKHDGSIELCESGLHASIKPLDALEYAPGPVICRVRMGSEIKHGNDKLVATERTSMETTSSSQRSVPSSQWLMLQIRSLMWLAGRHYKLSTYGMRRR